MKRTRRFLALVLALGLVALPVAAQRIADFEVGPGSLDFHPLITFERAVLTVSSPNGLVIRRELEASAVLSVNLRDAFGADLADGSYRVELTLQPKLDAATRAELAAAREAGDDEVLSRLKAQGRLPKVMVQRGSFSIVGGAVIAPGQNEPPRAQPKTNSDVAGVASRTTFTSSLCIGSECPPSPTFSDTTILMMEDNTRIKFDDTSTASGFPNRDWELQANSSSSGGPNQFALNDCGNSSAGGCVEDPLFVVEAGAPANSLFVDSGGRIGLRTATPALDLHLNTANTPQMRLEQNNSGGFSSQSWDIGGNEASFFVRDVTSGSRLPLRIRPGAPTSSLDIADDGDIGMGTASPEVSIDIRRSGAASQIMATTFSDDGNTFPNFIQRRAGGTSGAPTATQNNNILGSYSFRGYTGSTFTTENIARLEVRAEENFTTTANGTRIIFQTTQNGQTTPQTRLVIKNDGAVGIGTANPTAKLEVNGGSIRVTGGSFIDDGTTLNVPDYVFEPDYELRPLGELETFLSANKHLPGVPSRQEVRSEGLNLSEFQMRLLEKIEELTLYALQQEKRITELEARLAKAGSEQK